MKSRIFGPELRGLTDEDLLNAPRMIIALDAAMKELIKMFAADGRSIGYGEISILRIGDKEVDVEYTDPLTKNITTLAVAEELWDRKPQK